MSTFNDPGQWLGLLKWSLKYHDGTKPSEYAPTSQQDREWLEKFFKTVMVDEVARMKEIVDQLEAKAQQTEPLITEDDAVTNLFDELIDITSHIDSARDLNKIHKFSAIVHLLRSPHPLFRKGACDVIATCTQNNPDMQNSALSYSVLEYLAHMVVFDQDRAVRAKALSALSCVVRNNDLAERKFVEEGDGELILARGIRDGSDTRMQKRCMFLMLHLVRSRPDFADKAVQLSIPSFLLEGCSHGDFNDDLDIAEGAVQLLAAIGNKNPACKQALLDAGAVGLLQQRLANVREYSAEDVERAQVETQLINDLLASLTGGSTPTPAASQPAPKTRPETSASQAAPVPTPAPASAAHGSVPAFQPSHEWQPILPGQAIPRGLHVKMDMTTGERVARIPDPNDTREGTLVVAKPQDSSSSP